MPTPILAMIPSGFKTSKFASVLPNDGTGDFTVVRNSSKTRVNSLGLIETLAINVIAPDYTDGGCPLLLPESQATNLVNYSEDIGNTGWSTTRTNIDTNAINAPDGNLTANKAIASTANSTHRVDNVISLTSANVYTFSIFAKKGEYKGISIQIGNTSIQTNFSEFDLVNKVSNDNGTAVSAITEFSNDWLRCQVTMPSGADDRIIIGINNVYQNQIFTGDLTSGLFLWGAQLEESSNASSYIKTTEFSATRFADVVSINTSTISGTITSITETIDGVDQTPITTIPSTYTIPTGNINKIIME